MSELVQHANCVIHLKRSLRYLKCFFLPTVPVSLCISFCFSPGLGRLASRCGTLPCSLLFSKVVKKFYYFSAVLAESSITKVIQPPVCLLFEKKKKHKSPVASWVRGHFALKEHLRTRPLDLTPWESPHQGLSDGGTANTQPGPRSKMLFSHGSSPGKALTSLPCHSLTGSSSTVGEEFGVPQHSLQLRTAFPYISTLEMKPWYKPSIGDLVLTWHRNK